MAKVCSRSVSQHFLRSPQKRPPTNSGSGAPSDLAKCGACESARTPEPKRRVPISPGHMSRLAGRFRTFRKVSSDTSAASRRRPELTSVQSGGSSQPTNYVVQGNTRAGKNMRVDYTWCKSAPNPNSNLREPNSKLRRICAEVMGDVPGNTEDAGDAHPASPASSALKLREKC